MTVSGTTLFDPSVPRFAYVHCRPDGTVFYVGKGALRRAKNLSERNEYHKRVVAKHGRKNILIGMLECSTGDIALELERGLIKCLRRSGVKLTNATDGGEKGTEIISEETKRKLSEAAKKRGVSEACRAATVAARKGKPLSEEQRRKQSEAMKGIVFSEEHRANISASAKKRGMPLEVLAAAHSANKGRVQPPEERAKRSVSVKAGWANSAHACSIEIDGVVYPTISSASRATNINRATLAWGANRSGRAKGRTIKWVKV